MLRQLQRVRGALCLLGMLLAGCATYANRLDMVRREFVTGDLPRTEVALEKAARHRRDRDVVQLDRAVLLLAEGKPKEAEQIMREVRDRFDHLEQQAMGEKALSMLTDAQSEAYHGEDYEKVLVRVMLSLANLVSDGQDAGAYSLQAVDKQQQIVQRCPIDPAGNNLKATYKQVAFGPYLQGALREATHANYDDALRCYATVCSWQPSFPYGPLDVQRAKTGHHSQPGNGVLYVFALVGVGPCKVETVEAPTSVALLMADQIISTVGSQTIPPTIAPIKVPRVILTPHDVGSIGVAVRGRPLGRTATITDIGTMAVEQHTAVFDRIVAEAVVRRVVKKGVVYGVKQAMSVDRYSPANVALDLAGVAWEATESADTRCWGLLPDKIQVLRLELPEGQHDLTLQSLGSSDQPLGRPTTHRISIVNGRNTYAIGNFPYGNLVGTLLHKTP